MFNKFLICVLSILGLAALWYIQDSALTGRSGEPSLIATATTLDPTPAQPGLSGAVPEAYSQDRRSGCGMAALNPFASSVPPECRLSAAELEINHTREMFTDRFTQQVHEWSAGIRNGAPDSAATLLAHSDSCGVTQQPSRWPQEHPCNILSSMRTSAVGLLERLASEGNIHAQFHLANWLYSNVMAQQDNAENSGKPYDHASAIRAGELMKMAAAGGSEDAKLILQAMATAPSGLATP